MVETTALGAAYLAGLAVGYWKSQDEIRELWQAERVFDAVAGSPEVQKGTEGWKRAIGAAQAWSSFESQE